MKDKSDPGFTFELGEIAPVYITIEFVSHFSH